jgi:DNA topoisomerase-1
MGEHFTAKNFRTWHASVLAFELLAGSKEQLTIAALMEQVSDKLGNTPTIARKSYVHPAVVALVDGQAKWRARLVIKSIMPSLPVAVFDQARNRLLAL